MDYDIQVKTNTYYFTHIYNKEVRCVFIIVNLGQRKDAHCWYTYLYKEAQYKFQIKSSMKRDKHITILLVNQFLLAM